MGCFKIRIYLLLALAVASVSASVAQNRVDSLLRIWNNTQLPDTARFDARKNFIWEAYLFNKADTALILANQLLEYAEQKAPSRVSDALNLSGIACYVLSDYEQSITFFEKAFARAESMGDEYGMSSALSNIGNVVSDTGEYERAIELYKRAYKLAKKRNRKAGMASALNNIAIIKQTQGDIPLAIKLYMEALRLREKINDRQGAASNWHNIGTLYLDLNNTTEAKKCFEKSLAVTQRHGYDFQSASTLVTMGICYQMENKYERAKQYYLESLALTEKQNDRNGIATASNHLGKILLQMGQPDDAKSYFDRAMDLFIETENHEGMIESQLGMAEVNSAKNLHAQALSHAQKGYDIARENGLVGFIRDAAEVLYKCQRAVGQYDDALATREVYVQMRDSLLNEQNSKAVMLSRYQFEFDQKTALLEAELAARKQLDEAKINRKNRQRNAFIGGGGLMLVLALLSMAGYRRKKRDHAEILARKELVDKKNREIMENIGFALRLQESVLPPARLVKSYFRDSFLIYLPKDIVSGDFYWMASRDGISFFAVGDCTGHGVPGAMLSVLGLNGLNRCINELNLTEPHEILEQLSQMVQASFERSGQTVRDGMDIALCAFHHQTGMLHFSGANNPLWIGRGRELLVFKPNRRPVGFHENPKPFTSETLAIEPGDTLYLFTDGFADQIGGAEMKKFKTKNLRELIVSGLSHPISEQRSILSETFQKHKGESEQTDDVCIMAIKL